MQVRAKPPESLYPSVRAAFIQQGSSLNRWCSENGVNRVVATYALTGKRNGPAAKALVRRIEAAAGLECLSE